MLPSSQSSPGSTAPSPHAGAAPVVAAPLVSPVVSVPGRVVDSPLVDSLVGSLVGSPLVTGELVASDPPSPPSGLKQALTSSPAASARERMVVRAATAPR
jgi:hypothetical protein